MMENREDILHYLESAKLLINNNDDEHFIELMNSISLINEFVASHDCEKEFIIKIIHEVNSLIKELESKNLSLANKINDIRKYENVKQTYQSHD